MECAYGVSKNIQLAHIARITRQCSAVTTDCYVFKPNKLYKAFTHLQIKLNDVPFETLVYLR